MDITAEITEATFIVYAFGRRKRRHVVRARSTAQLHLAVDGWLDNLPDGVAVAWPADYLEVRNAA